MFHETDFTVVGWDDDKCDVAGVDRGLEGDDGAGEGFVCMVGLGVIRYF